MLVQAFIYQGAQFRFTRQEFVCFYAHYGKITRSIFSYKDGFRVFMAQFRNFIIIVSQVSAWSNRRHKNPPQLVIQELYQYFCIMPMDFLRILRIYQNFTQMAHNSDENYFKAIKSQAISILLYASSAPSPKLPERTFFVRILPSCTPS